MLSAAELPTRKVVACHVAGQSAVAFRGDRGSPHTMAAHCPHMGTHLARAGAVAGNAVVCRAHGWRIDADGQAESPDGRDRAHIRTWRTRTHGGAVEALSVPHPDEALPLPPYPRGWFAIADNVPEGEVRDLRAFGRPLRLDAAGLHPSGGEAPWPTAVVNGMRLTWPEPGPSGPAWAPPTPLVDDVEVDAFEVGPLPFHPIQVGARLVDLHRLAPVIGLAALRPCGPPVADGASWQMELDGTWSPDVRFLHIPVRVEVALHGLGHARIRIEAAGVAFTVSEWCTPIDSRSAKVSVRIHAHTPRSPFLGLFRTALLRAASRQARRAVDGAKKGWVHDAWLWTPAYTAADAHIAHHRTWAAQFFADPELDDRLLVP